MTTAQELNAGLRRLVADLDNLQRACLAAEVDDLRPLEEARELILQVAWRLSPESKTK